MTQTITPVTQPTPGHADSAAKIARDAFTSFQAKLQVPESARDFVKGSAASAKARVEQAHAGAEKATDTAADAMTKAVGVTAEFNRKVLDAAREDTIAALEAVEKVSGAKSLGEAFQLYVDFLRERGEVGMSRAKAVAGFVSGQYAAGWKQGGLAPKAA